MKVIRATIVLAALAVLLVVAPLASASPELTHPTGTRASVGTAVELTNVTHSTTPAQLVLTTGLGNFSCATATMTGTIAKNNGTEAQVEITTTEFGGTPEKTTSAHCQGSGALGAKVTLTPSHLSDESKSLPWCVTNVGNKDQFNIRGGKCSEAVRPLTFSVHGEITCGYEKTEMVGTYTTHPNDAIATVAAQEFKRTAGSSAFCPASGALDMALTMQIDGNPATPVYIS